MLFDTTEVAQLVGFITQIRTQVWTHLMKIEIQINLNLATKEKQNRIESRLTELGNGLIRWLRKPWLPLKLSVSLSPAKKRRGKSTANSQRSTAEGRVLIETSSGFGSQLFLFFKKLLWP